MLADEQNPDGPREAYFRQILAGTSWHPSSEAPLTQPPVSSVTVKVYELEMWEDEWEESHRHAEPGDPEFVFGEVGDDDGPRLLRCCGEDRPQKTPPLEVTASEKPYGAVHDYLSAVHPWLMGLRPDILRAKNVREGEPLPAEIKLMVNYNALDSLMIDEEQSRLVLKRGGIAIFRFSNNERDVLRGPPRHLSVPQLAGGTFLRYTVPLFYPILQQTLGPSPA
jgi:hypothetical protein